MFRVPVWLKSTSASAAIEWHDAGLSGGVIVLDCCIEIMPRQRGAAAAISPCGVLRRSLLAHGFLLPRGAIG